MKSRKIWGLLKGIGSIKKRKKTKERRDVFDSKGKESFSSFVAYFQNDHRRSKFFLETTSSLLHSISLLSTYRCMNLGTKYYEHSRTRRHVCRGVRHSRFGGYVPWKSRSDWILDMLTERYTYSNVNAFEPSSIRILLQFGDRKTSIFLITVRYKKL